MAEGETFGAWLSGDTLVKAKKRAKGNNSRYVRDLIERDLSSAVDVSVSNVLVELAEKFHPVTAADIRSYCFEADGVTQRISQSRLLSRLLEATAIALRSQHELEISRGPQKLNAIQAELARLRTIEDAFFQIAATIVDYGKAHAEGEYPFHPPDRELSAAETAAELPPANRPKRPIKTRSHGAGPDVDVRMPA